DAFAARQAGTVVEHQLGHAQRLPVQPQTHRVRGAGRAAVAQTQIELARHHIVAELVDVADEFGQRRRFDAGKLHRARRHARTAGRAGDAAAEFFPELAENAIDVLRVIEHAQMPVLLAATARITAGNDEVETIRVPADVGTQAAAPVAAYAIGQGDLADEVEIGRLRFGL